MKKWEYKTIVFEDEFPDKPSALDDEDLEPSWVEELNKHGQQGWELVSVIHADPGNRGVAAVMKREIGSPITSFTA